MKIVVVEDDPMSLDLLAKILKKHSIKAETFTSAVAALESFNQGNKADLIISDVMMPEMDGFELVGHLKGNKKTKNIPIILCTALNDKQSVVKGIGMGISDYITKPIAENTVIEKVTRAISRRSSILVVEDEHVVGDILKNILENEGYHVINVSNGYEALEIVQNSNIPLLISDINMPGMSGLELLIRVKADFPDIKVLLITGYTGKYSQDKAVAEGADGYLRKPFHNTDIINAVKRCL